MAKDEIIGVVFALPLKIVNRILSKEKIIFIKYFSKSPTKKSKIRIREGNKIFIYQSKSNRLIIGEGVVSKVHFCTKNELIEKFSSDLMLTLPELEEYAKGRENKLLLTLEIIKIKRYNAPIQIKKIVNMGGLYITEYNKNIFY